MRRRYAPESSNKEIIKKHATTKKVIEVRFNL